MRYLATGARAVAGLPGLLEGLLPRVERQAALVFTLVGRLLGQHVIARAELPA
jgi:hypothetical protein